VTKIHSENAETELCFECLCLTKNRTKGASTVADPSNWYRVNPGQQKEFLYQGEISLG